MDILHTHASEYREQLFLIYRCFLRYSVSDLSPSSCLGLGQLNVLYLLAIFISSAIIGDSVNFAIGSKMGQWAIEKGLVKQEFLKKTEK